MRKEETVLHKIVTDMLCPDCPIGRCDTCRAIKNYEEKIKSWAMGIVPTVAGKDCDTFIGGWSGGWNDCRDDMLKAIDSK